MEFFRKFRLISGTWRSPNQIQSEEDDTTESDLNLNESPEREQGEQTLEHLRGFTPLLADLESFDLGRDSNREEILATESSANHRTDATLVNTIQ